VDALLGVKFNEKLTQRTWQGYKSTVTQLVIEIYSSLKVSTANGIKFRFQFIKMSDRDLFFGTPETFS